MQNPREDRGGRFDRQGHEQRGQVRFSNLTCPLALKQDVTGVPRSDEVSFLEVGDDAIGVRDRLFGVGIDEDGELHSG